MAKSVSQVKSGLKLRAQAKSGALSIRLGRNKFALPFEVRLLQSEEFVFVHIPPTAEIMKIAKGALTVVTDGATAEKAQVSFRKSKKKAAPRAARTPQMPDELAKLLKGLPAGTKIGYGPDGSPRLIKTRKRRKSK